MPKSGIKILSDSPGTGPAIKKGASPPGGMKFSRAGILLSVVPGLVMVALFYSLAVHMRQSLGAWPNSIGEHGLPASLVAHASVTQVVFVLILATVFVLPLRIILCLLVPRWRRFVPYLALYGLMWFAPEGFLYWWRD